MNCAIYARVSTTDQECQVQLDELRRVAAARSFQIVGEYVDRGISGKQGSDRPSHRRLMQDARLGKFAIVLVVRMDRWGRSVKDIIDSVQELTRINVAFLATSQNITSEKSDPMSKFFLHMMACFAELERDLIHERSLAGIARAKQEGTRSGKPFGRPKRVFERDQAKAMRVAGKSWQQISLALQVPVGTLRLALRKPPLHIAAAGD